MRLAVTTLFLVVWASANPQLSAPTPGGPFVNAKLPTPGLTRCNANYNEVAEHKCCPKDRPVYYEGQCYAHCDPDHDDFMLGSYVGCREHCEGGYMSSVNDCSNGPSTVPRPDKERSGVAAEAQHTVAGGDAVSSCPRHHVRVHEHVDQATGARAGGCCPKRYPYLIQGKCYASCEDGEHHDLREELILGQFVACRTHCPIGWDETRNDCSKAGEESHDRGDFPRNWVSPVDRIVKPKAKIDASGCKSGYVQASNMYCCPAAHPKLIGLLCYADCGPKYEEVNFACRKRCRLGFTVTTNHCTRGTISYERKGYERHPKLPSLRHQ